MKRGRNSFFFVLLVIAQAPAFGAPGDRVVDLALSLRGVPYVYGAESPSGFDCSGFVRYVYRRAAGITLLRSAKAQYASGSPVPSGSLQAGDLLIFDTVGAGASHVGIYLGDGKMVHAASDGPRTGVIVSRVDEPYYAARILGARRVLRPASKEGKTEPAHGQEGESAAAAQPKERSDDVPVSFVGISIGATPSATTDKIPATSGSAIAFVLSNDTGADAVFEVLFLKKALDPSKTETLRRERVRIPSGGHLETEPYQFPSEGIYQLIVKTGDNYKKVERLWKVVGGR